MKATPSFPTVGSAGFTLVELLVVILIATILMSIAIPSYTSQTRKSHRTEARTALLDLAAREERYFSTNSAYTSVPGNLGYTGAFPVPVASSYYQLSVAVNAAGTTYAATAQPINSQASDTACGNFTLDNTGLQGVSGSAGTTTCWNK